MKDIIMLKKNGLMKVKDESKISNIDIQDTEWLLVNVTSTEKESRNYTLVKPSKLLLFDKAVITYQMCLKFQDCDMDIDIHEFSPVKFSTDSITDVISIINSADKLNIINNLMIEEFSDNAGQFGLTYMGITLIRDGNVIYDKFYRLKGIDGVLHDSYKVVKKFNELYDGNISREFKNENTFLIFEEKYKVMRWILSDKAPKKGMFGYPNIISNSITIMNTYEYSRISSYIGSTMFYSIYYDNKRHINSVTEFLKRGKYDEAFEKLDDSSDIFVNVARMLHRSYLGTGFVLSVICNLNFIFMSTRTMYHALYNSNVLIYDGDDIDSPRDFDSVLSITFRMNRQCGSTV